MAYTEIKILVLDEWKEIIIAELNNLGYDGVWEEGNQLMAYIATDQFQHKALYDVLGKYGMENNFSRTEVEDQNWNEVWEKNYDPVFIDDRICIRSPFHPNSENHEINVIIQPQMSFGTGHHETTRLCTQMMLTMDFNNKSVLDMGTGTGVLAILAKLLGAKNVVGIDIDPNCVENATENLKYNDVDNVTYLLSSPTNLPKTQFDIVLSNITKNINLTLLPYLAERVYSNGYLVLAGFLNFDLKEVDNATVNEGFTQIRNISIGDWECLLYQKK